MSFEFDLELSKSSMFIQFYKFIFASFVKGKYVKFFKKKKKQWRPILFGIHYFLAEIKHFVIRESDP